MNQRNADPSRDTGGQAFVAQGGALSTRSGELDDRVIDHAGGRLDTDVIPGDPGYSRSGHFGQGRFAQHGGGHRQAPADLSGIGPKGFQRSDDRLGEEIHRLLTNDHLIDASDVEISVRDGIVRIDGAIADRQIKHRIEDLVAHCSGVRDIENRLTVKRPRGGTEAMNYDEEEFRGRTDAGTARSQ